MMRRRRFLHAVVTGVVLVSGVARAQRAGAGMRIGIILYSTPVSDMAGQVRSPLMKAFVNGMRDLGWVEGQNIEIERRSAEGQPDRLPTLTREMADLNVRVIVVASTGHAAVAKAIAPTTPIVMAVSALPEEAGLVGSLAKPGGTVTGLSTESGVVMYSKRLQYLREVAPRISRIAVLTEWKKKEDAGWMPQLDAAAQTFGLKLLHLSIDRPERLEQSLANVLSQQPQALYIADDPLFINRRHFVADFAVKHRLPTVSAFREVTEAGGLRSYGVNLPDMFRRAASFVDRILKGAKPGDLPVEQPTKFELVINLKTGKALGLTIPPSLLLRADQVID